MGSPAPGLLHFYSTPLSSSSSAKPSSSLMPMLSHLTTPYMAVMVFIDVCECRVTGHVDTMLRGVRALPLSMVLAQQLS